MLEEVPLPADCGVFGREAFPCPNRFFQLIVCRHAKQSMHMVRHHEKKMRIPSVDFVVMPDGTNQGRRGCVPDEVIASLVRRANRQKINLTIRDPRGDFVRKVFSLGRFHGITEANPWCGCQQNERRRRSVRRPDPTFADAHHGRAGPPGRPGTLPAHALREAVGSEARPYLAGSRVQVQASVRGFPLGAVALASMVFFPGVSVTSFQTARWRSSGESFPRDFPLRKSSASGEFV